MKKAGILLVLLTACLGLPAREVINLNRDWRFFSYSEGSSDRAQNVNLPHTWNNDALGGKNDYFRGVGNYMKDIQVPLEWRNKRVFIRFSGAGTVTDLIVNGRHVGEHRGGFGAFTFELTGYLRYGEQNLLWAIVNNAPRLDVLPTAGDINIYGGLYRDVDLIVTEPSHIAVNHYGSQGVYVHQKSVSRERAELEAVVRIDGLRDRLLSVTATVVTPMRDTVASEHARFRVPAEGRGSVSVPIAMDNPRLWNGTADPFMYDVIVRLMDDSLLCDEVTVPLGLRYFSVDPKQGFLLNGSPYRLRGVSHYEDRASVGNALTPYQIAEDLDLIAEMGANAVRAAAYPHNESFYDECDRRGLVVLSELPLIGPAYMTDRGYINTEAFRDNGRDQLREMIFQQFNHPSVAVWGIFFDQTPRGDDPTAYVKELNSLAMLEDPSRLTSATSNQDGKINFVTDLVVWDHNYGWKEGLPSDIKVWLDQLRTNWGSLCSGISYGAGASIYHQDDSLYRPDYLGNWHPERWQTYLHEQYYPYIDGSPFLWGWFVANMFDYGAAGRNWGEGTGVDDRGLVTFDRKYRKDAFYFYKANWNRTEPTVWIAEKRWNRRPRTTQTVRVYSNADQVELWLNGASLGAKTGTNGTFAWQPGRRNEGAASSIRKRKRRENGRSPGNAWDPGRRYRPPRPPARRSRKTAAHPFRPFTLTRLIGPVPESTAYPVKAVDLRSRDGDFVVLVRFQRNEPDALRRLVLADNPAQPGLPDNDDISSAEHDGLGRRPGEKHAIAGQETGRQRVAAAGNGRLGLATQPGRKRNSPIFPRPKVPVQREQVGIERKVEHLGGSGLGRSLVGNLGVPLSSEKPAQAQQRTDIPDTQGQIHADAVVAFPYPVEVFAALEAET